MAATRRRRPTKGVVVRDCGAAAAALSPTPVGRRSGEHGAAGSICATEQAEPGATTTFVGGIAAERRRSFYGSPRRGQALSFYSMGVTEDTCATPLSPGVDRLVDMGAFPTRGASSLDLADATANATRGPVAQADAPAAAASALIVVPAFVSAESCRRWRSASAGCKPHQQLKTSIPLTRSAQCRDVVEVAPAWVGDDTGGAEGGPTMCTAPSALQCREPMSPTLSMTSTSTLKLDVVDATAAVTPSCEDACEDKASRGEPAQIVVTGTLTTSKALAPTGVERKMQRRKKRHAISEKLGGETQILAGACADDGCLISDNMSTVSVGPAADQPPPSKAQIRGTTVTTSLNCDVQRVATATAGGGGLEKSVADSRTHDGCIVPATKATALSVDVSGGYVGCRRRVLGFQDSACDNTTSLACTCAAESLPSSSSRTHVSVVTAEEPVAPASLPSSRNVAMTDQVFVDDCKALAPAAVATRNSVTAPCKTTNRKAKARPSPTMAEERAQLRSQALLQDFACTAADAVVVDELEYSAELLVTEVTSAGIRSHSGDIWRRRTNALTERDESEDASNDLAPGPHFSKNRSKRSATDRQAAVPARSHPAVAASDRLLHMGHCEDERRDCRRRSARVAVSPFSLQDGETSKDAYPICDQEHMEPSKRWARSTSSAPAAPTWAEIVSRPKGGCCSGIVTVENNQSDKPLELTFAPVQQRVPVPSSQGRLTLYASRSWRDVRCADQSGAGGQAVGFSPGGLSASLSPLAGTTCATPTPSLPYGEPRIPHSHAELRDPTTRIVPCRKVNLLEECRFSEAELRAVFQRICSRKWFQWFAGRSIVDFKLDGTRKFELLPPYDIINPILRAMIALAESTLRPGEELALVQVLINLFKDGGNMVKPHMHRCRQICLSLGAPRDLEVEGDVITMENADVLHIAGEVHAVPPSEVKGSRISICIFYGSAKEYASQSISVNAVPGVFGDSVWWTHPNEVKAAQTKGSI